MNFGISILKSNSDYALYNDLTIVHVLL